MRPVSRYVPSYDGVCQEAARIGPERGYAQLFGGDVEHVVTDRWELGPLAIRLWTIGHVMTVPILILVTWLGLGHTDNAES